MYYSTSFNFSFVTVFLLASLLTIQSQAALVPAVYSWVGDNGYRVQGNVIFENSVPRVSANGVLAGGSIRGIDYLDVSFFDPSEQLLFSTVDVLNGVSQYDYLRFSLITSPLQIRSLDLDIGQDTNTDGEYYLFGLPGEYTSLRQVVNGLPFEQYPELDSQESGVFSISLIPEPTTLTLATLVMLSLTLRRHCY